MTTQLVDGAEPLRFRIRAAGSLKEDSDTLIDQVRAIDNRRLVQGPLSRLPAPQLAGLGEVSGIFIGQTCTQFCALPRRLFPRRLSSNGKKAHS